MVLVWFQLNYSRYLQVCTVRNVAVVTSTSLLSLRRSHRGQCHSSHHTMHIHMLGQYRAKTVTHFSVFKLWFTLSASASAVAPESPILFHPRLWKRVFQKSGKDQWNCNISNYYIALPYNSKFVISIRVSILFWVGCPQNVLNVARLQCRKTVL